jgi:cytidine deaminase
LENGAVLYVAPKGKVAIGENSPKSSHGNNNINTHAEIDALNKLESLIRCKRIKKTKMDLIVIRINKLGNLCESAPCFHCTQELSESKTTSINKLYYSRNDGTITCIKFSDWVDQGTSHISKGWKILQRNRCCNKH